MADNERDKVSSDSLENPVGTVKIDDEVIASIAAVAASRVEGVANMVGGVTESLTEILGMKNMTKGVKLDVKDNSLTVSINISVKFGYGIPDLAHKVQKKVSEDICSMTGMKVQAVNLYIQNIVFDKNNEAS